MSVSSYQRQISPNIFADSRQLITDNFFTMKVAIQGELGSFSHAAALAMLPKTQVVPCGLSAEVFERLVSGNVNAAVIPIENSLAGAVTEHYDLLLAHPVFIQREFRLRIAHMLIAAPGVKLTDLTRVLSHPVALQQCRDFFRSHPNIIATPFYDTAGSVKHLMQEQLRDAAAIAGEHAAPVYGAHILRRNLEDDKSNYTRFLLVSRKKQTGKSANKTSIAFALKNVPGALFKALSVFALRDISLSRIESRPMRGRPWEYVFYVDFLRGDDQPARNALRHLQEISDFVKVLGIYPQAE
jgi:prephenate dehydratase